MPPVHKGEVFYNPARVVIGMSLVPQDKDSIVLRFHAPKCVMTST